MGDLRVGDRVRIKTLEELLLLDQEYNEYSFSWGREYLGKTAKIRHIEGNRWYRLDIDEGRFHWCFGWIDYAINNIEDSIWEI